MDDKDAKHLADYEKQAWEEIIDIARLRLKRIDEAEAKYKINKQKSKVKSK